MSKKTATVLIILIVLVFGCWRVSQDSFVKVNPGQRAVKTVWGQIKDSSYVPGLVWYIPYSRHMGNEVQIVDVQPQRYEYTFSVRTKDLQKISLKCALLCEMNDSQVHKMFEKYQGYKQYEEKVIRDMVNSTMLTLSALTDIWSFVGNEEKIITEAVEYIVRDQLLTEGLVKVKTFRLLSYQASPEFENLIEQTVQAKQGEKLEKYKSQMAKQATARVKEEAQQTYERMAAEAKAQGIEVELKAKALKNNPFVAQYELAKAIQKWNGELNLPQTLTMMEGANSSGTIIPFLKIGK